MQRDIVEKIIQSLFKEDTPIIPREDLCHKINISKGYMANIDSRGQGPKVKVYIGRRVAYEKQSVLEWLKTKLTVVDCTIKTSPQQEKESRK